MGELTLESKFRLRGTLLRVTDVNNLVGYGFIVEHGGLDHICVCWPDRLPERYTEDSAIRHGFVIEEVFSVSLDSGTVKGLRQTEFTMGEDENDENDESQNEDSAVSDQNVNVLLDQASQPNDELNSSLDESNSSLEAAETSLASTKIPGAKLLIRAGLNTIEDVKKYIAENGSLVPIKGIGDTLNAEILDFLASITTAD
jgi:NACalpha-BTF3-like transcription factor